MSFEISSIKLRGDRVIVSRPQALDKDEQRINGIIVPAKNHRDRWYGLIGTVVATGPNVNEALTPGARVIIGEFAGVPIFDGVQETPYWFVGESEIMAYVG